MTELEPSLDPPEDPGPTEEILDDRMSRQEIKKTYLKETLASLRDELDELYTEECNLRETIARLQDELADLAREHNITLT